MSNNPTVLVLPYPVQGHANPLMSFSHKLADHGCRVIFLNTEFNHNRVTTAAAKLAAENGSGSLIKLMSIPDGLSHEDDRTDFAKLNDAMLRTMPCVIEKIIIESGVNGEIGISCIVADVSMGWALEVACKVGIKGALFWPASAAMFALVQNIPKLIHDGIISSDGLPITKRTFHISESVPLMNTEGLFWSNIADPKNLKKIFKYIVNSAETVNLTEWWLCNTTHELEPGPISFVPKLLPIGPLLRSHDDTNSSAKSLGQFWEEDFSCMSWLDQQPNCSVVYVAFGSFTLFDQNQFNELALGLELTNKPFLWVVRQDSNCNKMSYPNEFKGNQGKIVKWAPQKKVLSHPAISCFVSHCGWNSTIEGLSNGLPFLCWPYFADQLYNKTYICDELKVGLGFDSDENGLVSRWEIKMKVDQLLGDDNIRTRSLELKEKLMNTIAEGGMSSQNFNLFVMWLKN